MKSRLMCEFRVTLSPLIALVAMLCVLLMDAQAHASRQGFHYLPQALAHCCSKVQASVPSVHETDRTHLIEEFAVAPAGLLAQGDTVGTLFSDGGQALVPGQVSTRVPSRPTTRFSVSELGVADRATDARPYITATALGEAGASLVLASVAPQFWARDLPAEKPAEATRPGMHLASGTSTASDSNQTQPAESDGGQTAGDTDGDSETSGEKPSPEFTGNASQASPDLDTSEEKALIEGGWK